MGIRRSGSSFRSHLCLLALLGVAALAPSMAVAIQPGIHTRFHSQGLFLQRAYTVYVPSGYDGSEPVPVVIDYHGLADIISIQNIWSGWRNLADAEGFIVIHPAGYFDSWNAETCCGLAWLAGIDDIEFSRAIVAAISAEANVDANRVYATGFSNGGAMSHVLACEAADVFRAVAPMSYPIPYFPPSDCQPSRPVPVLTIMGLNDLLVPYNGGLLSTSAEATVDHWRATNGCTGAAPDEFVTHGNSYCETYTQCAENTQVGLCSIDSGFVIDLNHIIYSNTDLDLAQAAWAFFEAQEDPPAVAVPAAGALASALLALGLAATGRRLLRR